MSRTRVHNLFVSLDGFAAGEHVTLDQPIGDAQRLFGRFDGRGIHGLEGVDAPITVDLVGGSSVLRPASGRTMAGRAGGRTNHLSAHRFSS